MMDRDQDGSALERTRLVLFPIPFEVYSNHEILYRNSLLA
jgi:hypothetical protein